MSAGSDHVELPVYELVLDVDRQLDDELQKALEYVRDRLVGEIPSVLTEIGDAVTTTFLAGHASEGIPIRIVDENGDPIELTPLTDQQEAEADAAAAEYDAWADSTDGATELDRADRLFDFIEARKRDTEHAYRAWLEERAGEFLDAKDAWHRARRATLEAEFDAHAGERG
ncbi:hypothetical protein [Microbacterium aurum]